MTIALAGLILISLACSSTRKTEKAVENEIKEKLNFAVVTEATGNGYTLHLRENNFFDFQGKDSTKAHLYAGTWERRGDSLFLGFHSNYHPEDLTGTGIFDRPNNLIILFSKDITRHRRLTIVK